MAKTYLGIDIGADLLKMAVCTGGAVKQALSEEMPENLVKEGRIVSAEAMVEFIKKVTSKGTMGIRKCAVILPAPTVYTQTVTLPAMSRDQLKINLPFEFRDFITQDKDKFFYDYAVTDTIMGEDGKPREFEFIAAATLKETVKTYTEILRKAGLILVVAIPEEIAYLNIIRYNQKQPEADPNRDYCFIDLGHTATRIHIFRGLKHQATRVIEMGMQLIDQAIADEDSIDEHVAKVLKHANNHEEQSRSVCMSIYSNIAVEIMRAVNFYRFNSPDNNLQEVFLSGGGVNLKPFITQITEMTESIGVNINYVNALLPNSKGLTGLTVSPAAIGATM